MFSARMRRLRQSLAFRLTLWYAGVFTLSSLAAFIVLSLSLASILQSRTDQELESELIEFSSMLRHQGMEDVRTNIGLEAQASGMEDMFLRVFSPEGTVAASSDMTAWGAVDPDPAHFRQGAGVALETRTVPGHSHRVRIVTGPLGQGMVMQIGQSLKDNDEFLAIVRSIFGITVAVLLPSAALLGWFMARRALRGVEAVTRTAREISQGALHQRVPLQSQDDEINELATTFNVMVDRIQALIAGMREINDNIAHDLRSPIARIRGISELALSSGGSPGEREAAAADTIEECDRLLGLINTMLDIAEFEADAGTLVMQDLDFVTLVRDAGELFLPLAEDKGVALTVEAPDRCPFRGDVQRLQRMVANLVDNAIKYTQPDGAVRLVLTEHDDEVLIEVTDNGAGITAADLPHIFTRFYRGDESRSTQGSGLGLSLAQAVAAAHGGSITVLSAPGKGSAFTVRLPRTSR